MISPYRGLLRIETDQGVEEYAIDVAENIAAMDAEVHDLCVALRAAEARERRWYGNWKRAFGAFLVAVAVLVFTWGGIWIGYFR